MHNPTGLFNKIKPLCTALFKSHAPTDVLAALYRILKDAPPTAFTPSLIEYTFFPISHSCESPHSQPPTGTDLSLLEKDEETCYAAALTLRALFQPDPNDLDPKIIPVLGNTLDTILDYTLSPNHSLQVVSLEVLHRIINAYFPSSHIPAVVPGVVSKMVRVAMGDKATSQVITLALKVLEDILERGVGDQVCIQSGALRDYTSLDDLVSSPSPPSSSAQSIEPQRTPTWLNATGPQVHVSLVSLSPLASNPNPLTRLALVNLCAKLAQTCGQSLENTQPVLVTHLLLLAYPALQGPTPTPPEDAQRALESLSWVNVQVVAGIVSRALSLLPHRLSQVHESTASSLARQLVSACHVLPASTIGALLGPGGGVEKWGAMLLSVVRFEVGERRVVPLVALDAGQVVEEEDESGVFTLQGLDTMTTRHISSVFTALGKKAGDQGVYAIEWFVGAGVGGSVAGLWCALWLLRGHEMDCQDAERDVGRSVFAPSPDPASGAEEAGQERERLEVTEYVKGLNPLTTLLDRPFANSTVRSARLEETRNVHAHLAIRLIATCHTILARIPTTTLSTQTYPATHTTNPSVTLLQYTIYPLLVENKGLGEVSTALGYASVENMLLANFDYALESVARRVSVFGVYAAGCIGILPRALETLRTLVRLVGSQIVSRASDVLDECFDRLDDFHGYEVVVGALVGVLAEVTGHGEENAQGQEQVWEGFLKWWKDRGKEREEWEFDLGEDDKGKDKDKDKNEGEDDEEPMSSDPPPLPPTQSLTRQIISRCTYFLTHPSPYIRAQILTLLTTAAPTLRASALLPPSTPRGPCVGLIETLVECVGDFMARRVWEDVWPRFEKMLSAQADRTIARRSGPVRAYGSYETYGARALSDVHVSILRTLAKAVEHVGPLIRRLDTLASCPAGFFRDALKEEGGESENKRNPDVVWLVLEGTKGGEGLPRFLKWDGEEDVQEGVQEVLNSLD
ncbi:HEAT repeat protein [Rhizoctonia solani]|uniref:HEAT repeat protein n=1 Tax=Rhizoctonia solani TaxID=456999 RepID=A0A8H7IBS9_9AGAM|nr:HEAT repeat protein [Rhizoctonia solani]